MSFSGNSYDSSAYYLASVSNIMKSIPEAVSGLSYTQTLESIAVSWNSLSNSWSGVNSAIGTGNDPVAYQIQKCLGSTCRNFANYGSAIAYETN